ncbi:MAG: hypothetical protein OEW77_00660 [Gemmatimonadota bacterium]|nr:hypothetical protein [Gemmatimonadota bacterium]
MRLRALGGLTLGLGALVAGVLLAAPLASRTADPPFPHEKHAKVFPVCVACHRGVVETGVSLWPSPEGCATCHDGTVQKRVDWQPRVGPRASNLRFTHDAHSLSAAAKNPADSALIRDCSACHIEGSAPRMAVQHAVVAQCMSCHGLKATHIDNPGDVCSTCHLRLTEARALTTADIKAFPKPASHDAPGFVLGGHGKAAEQDGDGGQPAPVAASCATCHARNFCLACHVNAPEVAAIGALGLDDRSPAYATTQPVPASHAAAGFLRGHGRQAQRSDATCATCHARASCTTCHVGGPPRAAAALPEAGPGRAVGARLVRKPPLSHTTEFRERHGLDANARPRSCETCHLRETCLQCHRPEGGSESQYHATGFLTRHPSPAYSREANCSDCHNPAQFCQSCHQQAGLVATARLGRVGYHDAFRGFSLGHGQAARQSLETCASCHAERDCTTCHSAVGGGYRFNPHGPGFNASRALAKNPSVCIACHGRAIPGVP